MILLHWHTFKVLKNRSEQNELNREFNGQKLYAVVVSDLTYVRINYKWNYICVLVDLFNPEIIGYSAGIHKDAQLVYDVFATVKTDLRKIHFKYYKIMQMQYKDSLQTFNVPIENAR